DHARGEHAAETASVVRRAESVRRLDDAVRILEERERERDVRVLGIRSDLLDRKLPPADANFAFDLVGSDAILEPRINRFTVEHMSREPQRRTDELAARGEPPLVLPELRVSGGFEARRRKRVAVRRSDLGAKHAERRRAKLERPLAAAPVEIGGAARRSG